MRFTLALRSRRPRCGKGKLFAGFLTLQPRCEVCGLDYGFADSGDLREKLNLPPEDRGSYFHKRSTDIAMMLTCRRNGPGSTRCSSSTSR